jgi:serine/threonine-protein kinase
MTPFTRAGELVAGKYRIERVLGQGGIGIVMVAQHLLLRERVAIKFPVPRMRACGDIVDSFVREGSASMRLRSQHVARVYDVGMLETGEPYLVMEYLAGRDLAAVLATEGPLPVDAAVDFILQAGEALAEAHAKGIVHRDVKPSNLFLCEGADASPVVKVLDFGAAKTHDFSSETARTDATVVGTPLFMAPEQMRVGQAIDARADIWALGATLYTLLAGKPPFRAASIADIHKRILRGPPPLRASRSDAPAALESILLRCMQIQPSDRYPNLAELAEALAEVAPEHARHLAVRAARILRLAQRAVEPLHTPTMEAAGTNSEIVAVTETSAPPSWFERRSRVHADRPFRRAQ